MLIAIVSGVLVVIALALAVFFLRRRQRPAEIVSASTPFICDFSKYEVAVPLNKDFRFAHEPLARDSNGRFVGRKAELEALALRILFSEGGSFLVTGYRGVGKTSFVNQVVRKLEEIAPWAQAIFGETKIIDVQLNLARPLTPAELMHHIIRRLYEELQERKILSQLDSTLRDELKLAYDRTSFNMTRTLGEEIEKNIGLDQTGFGNFLAALKGTLSYSKKHSEGSEYEFVGYDDKAAEHDIVSVSRKLVKAFEPKQKFSERVSGLFVDKQSPTKTRLLIVFVFDELDKLEEFTVTQNGRTTTAIDDLLGALKNVFTTSGVSFVFVAGKDTQERWLEDLGKGDSVYESVFAYDKYLPCMWSDVNELCDGFIDQKSLPEAPKRKFCTRCGAAADAAVGVCLTCGLEFPPPTIIASGPDPKVSTSCPQCSVPPAPQQMFCDLCGRYRRDPATARTVFEDFKKYLDYRGRGIPRRIIRGFNEHVYWSGERPILVFTKNDIRRIRVYAELRDLLAGHEVHLFGEMHEEILGTIRDKRRLGVYYLTDWILRQGNSEFTVKDAVAASKRLSTKIAPAEEVALNVISDIIKVLVDGEFLSEVEERLDKVRIDDISAKQEKRYKLLDRRLIEMRGDADSFAADMYIYQQVATDTDHVGHYQLLEKVGTGGMGTVYRAWNEQTGQVVAVKILSREFSGDPQAVERFRRESQIMSQLRHPNIVKCYETAEDKGRLFIAMEFVEGIDLGRVLGSAYTMPLAASIHIARAIADALQYIHGLGFIRNDIKPGNVMLSKNGNIYLMDFGITKQAAPSGSEPVTLAGTIVGTPYYMSPEQFKGEDVDVRSDIYSFGVVFYEMITGEMPFKGSSSPETMYKHLHEQPTPPSQIVPEIPKPVEHIILKCLEKDPQKRFQKADELLAEIKKVDEQTPAANIAELVSKVFEAKRSVEARAQRDTHESPTVLPPPSPKISPMLVPGPPPRTYAPSPIPTAGATSASIEEGAAPKAILELSSADEFSTRPGVAVTYAVKTPRMQIGRAPANDISLNDPAASRFHADIELREGRYYLRDLNTSNGTLLNGLRINEPRVLSANDLIQIGKSRLQFRFN